jgi:hypothetical protein
MKKKILGVLVALLALALLTVPVMGAPATKKPATIVVMGGGPVPDEPPRFVGKGTPGTISHATGGTAEGATVTLTIEDIGTFTGDWDSDWKVNRNWPLEKGIIRSKLTMTFTEGTFEGVNQRRIYGPDPYNPDTIEDYCVFKGISGMFTGWTLKIRNTVGYAIIPK